MRQDKSASRATWARHKAKAVRRSGSPRRIRIGSAGLGLGLDPARRSLYLTAFLLLPFIAAASLALFPELPDLLLAGTYPVAAPARVTGGIYVLNTADQTLAAIDPATDEVRGRPIRLRAYPTDLAVYRGKVYVTLSGLEGKAADRAVAVVEPGSGRASHIPLEFPNPLLITATPGGTAYVTHGYMFSDGTGFPISVIDLDTNTVTGTLRVKGSPGKMTVGPDGNVYIPLMGGGPTNFGLSNILVLDPRTGNMSKLLAKDIEVPPTTMAFAPDGRIWATYPGYPGKVKPGWLKDPRPYTRKVKAIDLESGRFVRDVDLETDYPQVIAIAPDGLAFITHFDTLSLTGGTVTVLDTRSGKVVRTISGLETPTDIWLEGGKAYVPCKLRNAVAVIDLARGEIIKEIPTGRWPGVIEGTPPGSREKQ